MRSPELRRPETGLYRNHRNDLPLASPQPPSALTAPPCTGCGPSRAGVKRGQRHTAMRLWPGIRHSQTYPLSCCHTGPTPRRRARVAVASPTLTPRSPRPDRAMRAITAHSGASSVRTDSLPCCAASRTFGSPTSGRSRWLGAGHWQRSLAAARSSVTAAPPKSSTPRPRARPAACMASQTTLPKNGQNTSNDAPVTFLIVPSRGPSVARPGMTYCPCRADDPGGVVAGSGGVGGPLIGTRPPPG